jgi:succinate dehydrogenase / fumarate reductase cytochrome b subunit
VVHEPDQTFLDKHYFLLRRLHSLAGVFPIGAFLIFHLTTNASIVWGNVLNTPHIELPDGGAHAGVETFQHEVNFIHDMPALILIEFGVLFLPIAFHAILGVWFGLSGKSNLTRYKYMGNVRYTLQRWTGYLGVIFIFMHVLSLRFGVSFGGLMPAFDGDHAASSTALHFKDGAWGLFSVAFYLVCVLGLVFHMANGLWTAALTWGLTVSVAAQKRWGYICLLIGLGLAFAAVLGVVGFATLDVDQAKAIEDIMLTPGGH